MAKSNLLFPAVLVGAGAAVAYHLGKKKPAAGTPTAPSAPVPPGGLKPQAPAAPAAPKPPAVGVALIGDSLMVGASQKVKTKKYTTADTGAPLKAMKKQLGRIPAGTADSLVISGGINDLAGGAKADVILSRAEDLWNMAKQMGFRVAHLEMTPSGGGPYEKNVSDAERVKANELLAASAAKKDVAFLRTAGTFNDPENPSRLRPELAAKDKLHLNPEGYEKLAGIIDNWLAGESA